MALAGAELFHLTGSSSSSSDEESEEATATARTDNFMEVVRSMFPAYSVEAQAPWVHCYALILLVTVVEVK